MGIEDFQHRGEAWRRITHEPREKFIVGIDLGCSVDPTAICVMHFRKIPLDTWKVKRTENRNCRNITEQEIETRYDVVHLERMGLGVAYPAQVQHIKHLLGRDPLRHAKPDLIVDASGVGLPVVQLLDEAGLRPLKVSITSGAAVTRAGNRHWHVAKSVLISGLDAALHTGELKFAPELRETPTMKEELANFDRHVAAAGRATYAARTGAHDDLVLSCALCVWRARGGGPGEVHVGTIIGLY